MTNLNPMTGDAMPHRRDDEPSFGEMREVTCPRGRGHLMLRSWRPASESPWETLAGLPAAAELERCPACGDELVETRTLIDGDLPEVS